MRFLYTFGYLGALAVAGIAAPFVPKIRRGLAGRRGAVRRIREVARGWKRAPVWIHVASSGELEQSIPIMEEIKRADGDTPIFLSYFSPSGERAARLETERRRAIGESPPWDLAEYSPLDLGSTAGAYLAVLRPSRFVAIHREIWPNLLVACKRRNIPCYLLAGNFPASAMGRLRFYRRWLGLFDFIGTVNDTSTAHLILALETDQVQTLGDPRIDRVVRRRDAAIPPAWGEFLRESRVFVAGSVWPRDMDALGPLLALLRERGWRIVVAPHEVRPGALEGIRARLGTLGIEARRWSDWTGAPDRTSHLVLDRVGPLAELYRYAALAFVGGSFHARVHNVLEPAVYGVPVLTGPRITSSAEAVELEKKGGLFSAKDGVGLRAIAMELLDAPGAFSAASSALGDYVTSRSGAAARCAAFLV